MDKINCNVINDLLPLYVDEVVSDDTKAFVENHLASCEGCRAKAEKMSDSIEMPVSEKVNSAEKSIIKKAKRKFLNKKIIVAITSAVVAIAVIFGLYWAANCIYFPIEYDADKISITTDDNYIYLNYDGIYSYHHGYGEDTVIGGEKKSVWIIEVEYNLWDKYIEPLYKKPEEQYSIYIDEIDNCDIIYYGNFDTNDEFSESLDDCLLIWEK